MLNAVRSRWYVASIVAGLAGGAITVAVHRATGNGFPFFAGFAMLSVLFGGFGPCVLAAAVTLAIGLFTPPIGTGYGTTDADIARLLANAGLLFIAAAISGKWRQSRITAAERELRLREAAERMEELLEGSSDGVVLADAALKVTYVNTPLEQLVGIDRQHLIGRSLEELRMLSSSNTPPLSLARLRGGESVLVEDELRRSDGQVVPVEASLRMLSGGRIFASVRDITERRRHEERRLAERSLLDGILATSVAGVIVVDLEGEIIFGNGRGEELLGLTRSASPDRHYNEPGWVRLRVDGTPLPPDERPYAGVIASGNPVFDVRHSIQWPDGKRAVFSVNGSPLHREDGSLRAVVLAMSDITLALEADRALRERDAELERVTRTMPGMVYTYRMDSQGNGRFLYASQYSVSLLNLTPEEIIADPNAAWRYVHPDDEREMHRTTAAAYQGLTPWTHEFRWVHPQRGGEVQWLMARATPEQVPGSDAVVWAGILVDVTERRRLEDELRQAQKMESVGRLAGGVAHDFNNLLTVILGHAELLALDLPADEETAESIAQIRSAASSGSSLTRQLLGFARKQVVAPQIVEVNALVSRLPPLVRRLVGESVVLETTLNPDAGRVRIDPAQLDQVLMNLVVNAMDAMPTGGTLQISTSHLGSSARRSEYAAITPGPLVEIIVRDSGTGMTEEVRMHAFDPFFTTKEQGKGTGLGLATSYGIISQAGGLILLDSKLGFGTGVRVLLPASDEPAPPTTEPVAEPRSGHETILVVDDDARVRAVTAESLRRYGYAVIEAESGLHALAAARESGIIHLLVTDVVMPGMSGRALADALQHERPSMRVLYVSGYTAGAVAQHGVIETGVSLLEKPYDRAELALRVRELLTSPLAPADV